MKVLLGWELGAGQGHIQRLAVLAERLAAQGWEPIFALKAYNAKGIDFPWTQLVPPLLPFSGRENSYTFADILATFGFIEADILRSHLQQWQDLINTVQPSLVIADHAPGLVLAARGRVPTLVVGSPFAVPPPLEVFPAFRANMPLTSAEQQQRVSEVVRQVIPLEVPLGQALNGDRSFIFSIPEVDCYAGWRSPSTQYVSIQVAPLPRCTPTATDPNWIYVMPDYPDAELINQIFQTESQFRPLQEALMQKAIAIHHGGLTTTVACALAGVPQLILPRYIEQQLNGVALLRFGAAQMLTAPTEEQLHQVQSQIGALISRAQVLAEQLGTWNQNFISRIIDACFDLYSQ